MGAKLSSEEEEGDDDEEEQSQQPDGNESGDPLSLGDSVKVSRYAAYPKLTKTQIKLIENIWKEARRLGPDEPGVSILSQVLLRAPEVEKIFNFVQLKRERALSANQDKSDRDTDSPRLSAMERRRRYIAMEPLLDFRVHARRFTLVLDRVVQNLNDLESNVDEFLVRLGQKHASTRSYGFSTHLWDIFAESMIVKTLGWGMKSERTNSAHKAWSSIIIYVVGRMKDGYCAELRKLGRYRMSLQALDKSI